MMHLWVGGSVPVFDEVVISLARMNDIINLDVEAGMYDPKMLELELTLVM